jgi:hypothetical protein
MKKSALVFGMIALLSAELASAQLLGAKGLNFVAPQVSGTSNVGNPQAGEIVYDITSNSGAGGFWGYNSLGSWVALNSGVGPVVPTVTTYTSGTGLTYTTPANVLYLRVRMVGGGGGGNGTSSNPSGSSAGGTSTFNNSSTGTAILTAGGGTAGGGGGGTPIVVSPTARQLVAFTGTRGGQSTQLVNGTGGNGGSSPFGGGGPGGIGAAQAGIAAVANTGSGGGGGGGTGIASSGEGGSAGAYLEAIIPNPDPTYTYTVGTAGSRATGGTNFGGNGAAGFIEITEYYQ